MTPEQQKMVDSKLYTRQPAGEPPVRSSELVRPHRIYVFVRAEGFYPLELTSDDEARANAECNPGTLRVENQNGETVWPNSLIGTNPRPKG